MRLLYNISLLMLIVVCCSCLGVGGGGKRCSGAGTHGNGVPTQEIEWERRSHKRNFERYLFIIAIKL